MIYVALLRGINVGGKNKIEMKKLKETFESVGMKSVITYINSGNVIFEDLKHTKADIISILEEAIYEAFTLNIKVLILSINDLSVIIDTIPNYWENDKDMKSDVLFLWEEVDDETVLNELVIKPTIDTVLYVAGAILWSVDKKNVTKSGIMNLASMKLYKKMTIRNVNSTRKIYTLMQEILNNQHENS